MLRALRVQLLALSEDRMLESSSIRSFEVLSGGRMFESSALAALESWQSSNPADSSRRIGALRVQRLALLEHQMLECCSISRQGILESWQS